MCGICGEIRFDARPASLTAVEKMSESLSPRGPDAWGAYARENVALGQRRLKIIDLSERAAQPMIDSESGVACVFNGCIYNYRELKKTLESLGHRFFSSSDTEVLLRAYLAWGDAFVERLNGMFAFAIHERASGKLLLGRDRLGIKPLYYAEVGGALRFASTLPALVAAGGVNTEIDSIAFHHYMHFHSVVPAPWTLLSGVRKVPPATLLRIHADGRREETKYWTLRHAPGSDGPKTEAEYKQETLEVLRRAVERRLVADVPVGVLLSGGLDSSLVVGLLAEAGQHGLATFSIGFQGAGGEAGNEFEYSDIVARRFGTNHHKIDVSTSDMLPALEDCVRAMSEPMVSHDAIGFYLLSKEVKKHVKVVECGQGADEIFAGYHWYPPLVESKNHVADYARAFFDRDHHDFATAVDPRFVSDDHSRRFVEAHFATPGAERAVDKALRLDTTVMLVDDPVKRVDNMTMRWGLEARVPFLDHEVVEFAASVPAELKVAQGGKHILKEAARDVVPHEVIDRPKGYFPVPVLKYIQGPTLELVRDVLSQPAAQRRSLFRPQYVERLLSEPSEHLTPLGGSKLWQIALLEYWLQTHSI